MSAFSHKMKEIGRNAASTAAAKPVTKKRTHTQASASSDFSDSDSDGESNDFVQATPSAKKTGATPGRKPKKAKKVRDPNMPKRPSNHFMLFMEESRAALVAAGFRGKHVMQEASNRWKALSDAEKAPYTAKVGTRFTRPPF